MVNVPTVRTAVRRAWQSLRHRIRMAASVVNAAFERIADLLSPLGRG
jgi:hypothetical protein